MNVLERDALRKIIELATGLLGADRGLACDCEKCRPHMAVDAHDDVKPDQRDGERPYASTQDAIDVLGPHYRNR